MSRCEPSFTLLLVNIPPPRHCHQYHYSVSALLPPAARRSQSASLVFTGVLGTTYWYDMLAVVSSRQQKKLAPIGQLITAIPGRLNAGTLGGNSVAARLLCFHVSHGGKYYQTNMHPVELTAKWYSSTYWYS